MEEFFHEVGKYSDGPQIQEVLSFDGLSRLFHDHGMDLAGPPLAGEWKVDENGMIVQTA